MTLNSCWSKAATPLLRLISRNKLTDFFIFKIPLYWLRSRPAKAFDSSVHPWAMCALKLNRDLHSQKLLKNWDLWIKITDVASIFRSSTQKTSEEPIIIRILLNFYIWCKSRGTGITGNVPAKKQNEGKINSLLVWYYSLYRPMMQAGL